MVITRKPIETWKIKKDLIDDCNAMFPHKNILQFNKGMEEITHIIAKTLVMMILREAGKEAYSEVKLGAGIVDIIVLGQDNLIIELETNLTEEGKQKKVDQYDNKYIREFIFIDLKKLPENYKEAYDYLKDKIENVKSD